MYFLLYIRGKRYRPSIFKDQSLSIGKPNGLHSVQEPDDGGWGLFISTTATVNSKIKKIWEDIDNFISDLYQKALINYSNTIFRKQTLQKKREKCSLGLIETVH